MNPDRFLMACAVRRGVVARLLAAWVAAVCWWPAGGAAEPGAADSTLAPPPSDPSALALPAGAGPVLIDRVIAIVDEEPVLQSDVEREIALYKLERGQEGGAALGSDAEIRQEVLDRLVESKLMIAAAKEAEIKVEDEEIQEDVQANIDELVRHFGSQEGLERELERNGMNLADYRARTTDQVRDRRYMSAVVARFIRPRVEVREDEVEAFYHQHAAEIPAAPDSLRLASILVPVQPSAEAQREAQRKLGAVLQELGEGRPFAEVARRHTEGPNAERGGAMGVVRPGELFDRRLDEAVFALQVGQTSRPIVTERGLHLIHLDEVTEQGRVISQIFFPLQIGAADVEAARARAVEAHGRVMGGEPFAKVAVEVSADPNAAQGGELGLFPLDDLSPRFQEALRGLAAGGVTDPIQTPGGFYIFLVKERVGGRAPTYAEVKESARRALEAERLEAELTKYVAGLRGRFFVSVKD